MGLTPVYAVDELRTKTTEVMDATEFFKNYWQGIDPLSDKPIILKGEDLIKIVDNALAIANSPNDMTKDELIVRQQLQIEELKKKDETSKSLHALLMGKFYAIGQPLNDNVLQMNKAQLKWCFGVAKLIEDGL